jgi:hypothetical protein
MLPPAKVTPALYAIHLILVHARYLAGEAVDSQRLYKLFDWAEILPSLITRQDEDTTEEFRDILAGLGEDFPECAGFLSNFDNGLAWDTHAPVH